MEIFNNYIIYENGDIFNKCKKKFIKIKENGFVKIRINGEKKELSLSKLVYENYIGSIKENEFIGFRDKNNKNFHYSNLKKYKRKWKLIKNYEDYKISNDGQIYSMKNNIIMSIDRTIKLRNSEGRKHLSINKLLFETFGIITVPKKTERTVKYKKVLLRFK